MQPWEQPNSPWKNKTAFFTWLRGGLRRGAWNRHPIKISKLKSARYKSPIGKNGKEVWTITCEMCKEEHRQSEAQVDHITPAGKLNEIADIQGFVERLIVITEEDLRVVCKFCNSALAYSDRYNVTFKEAVKRKREIAAKKKKKGK